MNECEFLFPCDQKLAQSQFSPTHTSTKRRKRTEELKQNAEQYAVNEGCSPVGRTGSVMGRICGIGIF